MGLVTLRVIDGPNRGKVFSELSCPVTIGREEGNIVELIDERISRFHLKIFQESGKLVLADLGSTNGTQVNGEVVHLWILRPGDLIQVGKSLLLFGTKNDILRKLKEQRGLPRSESVGIMGCLPDEDALTGFGRGGEATGIEATSSIILEQEFFADLKPSDLQALRSLLPPSLPDNLSNLQNAQVSELLLYFTLRLRSVISGISSHETPDENVKGLFGNIENEKKRMERVKKEEEAGESDSSAIDRISISSRKWQGLLDLYSLFSNYLEKLSRQ